MVFDCALPAASVAAAQSLLFLSFGPLFVTGVRRLFFNHLPTMVGIQRQPVSSQSESSFTCQ